MKEESKHRISEMKTLSDEEEIFEYVKKYIRSLFKNRFTTVRINYSKEIQLLFYLISFVKIIDGKQITMEKLEQILHEGEEDAKIKV